MSEVMEGAVLLIGVAAIFLCGLVIYMCLLLVRIEGVLGRVIKALRGPEVKRDWAGRALYERGDK